MLVSDVEHNDFTYAYVYEVIAMMSSNHLSQQKVITVLLTPFLMLYIICPGLFII